MIKKFFNENWIYFSIVLGFIAIVSIYFAPAFQGYVISQGDMSSWKSMVKEILDFREVYGEEAIWTNSMFGGMPGYMIDVKYLNGFSYVKELLAFGLPYPLNHVFIALISFFILGKALKIENKIIIVGAIAFAFVTYHMLIIEAGHKTKFYALSYVPAIVGFFIMIYQNKKVLFPTILLSIFLALQLLSSHVQMTYYMAFILVFIGVFEFVRHFKEKILKTFFTRTGFILIAGVFALLANFTSYYYTYSYAKVTMRGTPEITVRPEGEVASATNQSSGLDRDYIVKWCYGIGETYNLLVPNTKMGSRSMTSDYFDYLKKENPQQFNYAVEQYQKNQGRIFGNYWGNQPFTSGPNYIGAIMVFLALLYLIFVNSHLKWALLAVSILSILLSWGKNLGGSVDDMWLTNFFIDYIPLYSKFRAVSSILTIVNFTIPFMAVLFLNHLHQNKEWATKNLKKITIASGAIVGIILVFTFVPSFFDFTSKNEQAIFENLYKSYTQYNQGINPIDVEEELVNFRINVFQKDSYRTLFLILLAFGLIYFWLKDKLKFNVAISILICAVLIDIWTVDKRYLNNEKNPQNKRSYLSWEKQTGYENTVTASDGDKQIYQIEAQKNPKVEQLALERINKERKEKRRLSAQDEESIRFSTLNFNSNYRVLNLDNPFNSSAASYFHKSSGGYHAAKLQRYQDMIDFYISKEFSFLQEPEKMKVLNMLNTKYYLYQGKLGFENPYIYGNAWFVNSVKMVNNPNEEILAIKDTDVKNMAIVDKVFENQVKGKSFSPSSEDIIQMESYLPNKLIYKTQSKNEQLAIFSEIYYKDGWNAYIDDKKVDHLRANYILRGLVIPAGNHTVTFKFEPEMYAIGNYISLAAFLIIMGALFFAIYQRFVKKDKIITE